MYERRILGNQSRILVFFLVDIDCVSQGQVNGQNALDRPNLRDSRKVECSPRTLSSFFPSTWQKPGTAQTALVLILLPIMKYVLVTGGKKNRIPGLCALY